MLAWIINILDKYQDILLWVAFISLIMFIASLILIPWFLKNMPDDYFISEKYHIIKINTPISFLLFIFKNLLGIILILAGVIMLFTPGQGIISIIIGLFLMQFKGKYKLERKILQNDLTFKALNWIREKNHKPPFKR